MATERIRVGQFYVNAFSDDEFITPTLRLGYEWDTWMRDDLSHLHCPGTDILDIGGNIGINALLFSDYGPVHTFEPAFHELLKMNIEQNTLKNPVVVHPYGLSNASRTAALYFAKETSGHLRNYGGASIVLTEHREPESAMEVQLKRLDSVYSGVASVMKVDVEGHELEVLLGGIGMLRAYAPAVFVEIFGYSSDHPIVGLLTEVGYNEVHPRPDNNYLFLKTA